ncbi:MAG: hypothetical protein Q8P59_14395, partial [Dehalococcoidia bacterium]|nr:hypothetical protein [Dehalococcoidia bacterium]
MNLLKAPGRACFVFHGDFFSRNSLNPVDVKLEMTVSLRRKGAEVMQLSYDSSRRNKYDRRANQRPSPDGGDPPDH